MDRLIPWAIFLMLAAVILMNSGWEHEWLQRKQKKAILQMQRERVLGKKTKRIEKYITSERQLVQSTNTEGRTYVIMLVVSIALGGLFGKLVFMDTAISMCVAGLCIILPHVLLILKGNREKRIMAEKLESAMRIITHEYIATQDLQRAVENSVDVIDHDKPFRQFLVDCKLVSADMERNLRRLEAKERNTFFSRWIDQLILTQSDRAQIVNLMPILDEMNDAKTAQRQNDTQVAGAWREYITMMAIILLSPLLIRTIQHQWYEYLVNTPIGKLLIVLMLACLVMSTLKAMKINKPITG